MNNKIIQIIPLFIRNDFFRKFFAVLLATIVWALVKNKIETKGNIDNVLVTINTSPDISVPQKQRTVSLTVKASKNKFTALSPSDFKISKDIDFSNYNNGEPIKILLSSENIDAPTGVTVLDIKPNEFIIDIDKIISKKIFVKHIFDHETAPPEDYKTGKVEIFPESISIRGPYKNLKNILSIKTKPIPIDAKESFEMRVNLNNIFEKEVSINQDDVRVKVEITNKYTKRIFQKQKVKLLEKEGFKIEEIQPMITDIKISALKTEINQLKDCPINPYIDLANIKTAGVHEVSIEYWQGNHKVKFESMQPKTIKIKLIKNKIKEKEDKTTKNKGK